MSCSCKQAKTSACNPEVDYSTVPGEQILPFQVSLNLSDSIPAPSAGEDQRATVCVPVTVTPFVHVGTPVINGCGDPAVTAGDVCPHSGGSCRFTVSQELCVAVSVEFGAQAVAGTPSVRWGEAGNENICANCPPADGAVSDH